MHEMSRYRESSVRQRKQEEVSNNRSPPDAEIDSGDDLFITQKPVPEAVRSRRRPSCKPKSPVYREEDENDSSSSSSNSESRNNKKKKKQRGTNKSATLPKFIFPFLLEGENSKNTLLASQNISLHISTMGGFFKCVRELCQDYGNGDDVPSSLPTVDMDGEYISPLSEEEERSESEDIKVVERKEFVAASNAKGIPQKSVIGQRGKSNKDGQGISHGRQTTRKDNAMSADTESSDDGGPSRGVRAEKRTRHARIWAQTEPPQTERHLTRASNSLAERKEKEDELCHSSDATVCELLELQKSPRYHSLNGTEDDLSQTGQLEKEAESQSLLQGLPRHINNDIMCSQMHGEETNTSKRDHEHAEETCSQSREEPDGLPTARSVNLEADGTPGTSEENPLATQISDELEIRHTPDTKREEKKRKKKKREADHVGQEEDGNLESDVRVENDSLSLLTSNKKKKKKKRRYSEDDKSVEQQQSSTVSEPLKDNADAPRKKKKKKKDKEKEIVIVEEDGEEELENIESSQERLESTCEKKRKKHKKKRQPPDGEEAQPSMMELENIESSQERLENTSEKIRKKHKKKRQTPPDDAVVEQENVEALSHDATLEESTAQSVKKKKKKKKRENLSEDEAISCMTDQKEKVDDADPTLTIKEGPDIEYAELVVSKKKKKKKSLEKSCRNVTVDTGVTQNDGSVSARKKKKRRTSSFLDADAEEKDAQSHGEQSSPASKAVAVPVARGIEKPGVSMSAVEAESVEESHVVVRKKKKKSVVTKIRIGCLIK